MFIKNNNLTKLKRFRGGNNRKSNNKGIFLDRNERIIPYDQKIKKKIESHILNINFSKYPDVNILYKKISKWLKISTDKIFITEGLDGAIRLIFQSYTKPNKSNVIFPDPSFAMYKVYSKMFGLKVKTLGYDKNYKLEYENIFKLANKNTAIIFLPNPNMPIEGFLLKTEIEKIAKFCDKNNIILFIDEVYFHFNKFSSINLLNKYKNIFVARSFSKAFGLAGIRLGYLLSNKNNISYVSKLRTGYECNSLSSAIAIFFINNFQIIKDYINEINLGSIYLKKELTKLSVAYNGGTYGNSVYINMESTTRTNKIVNYLKKKNIYVRGGWSAPFNKGFSLSLSSKEIMKKFIKEFNKAIKLY